jgi:predicted solute-binding protein
MYVNRWTRGYGPEGRRAVQLLLDRAHAAGLTPAVVAEYVPGNENGGPRN